MGFLAARCYAPLVGGVAQLGERLNGIQEVRGSIPLASITGQDTGLDAPKVGMRKHRGLKRGNSSVGRAQPCQGWGRGFESRFPLGVPLDCEAAGR